MQLLCQRLHARSEVADFLDPVLGPHFPRRVHELQVVHIQEIEPDSALEPARAALHVVGRLEAGVVDDQPNVLEPPRRLVDIIELALLDCAHLHQVVADAGADREGALAELFARHFEAGFHALNLFARRLVEWRVEGSVVHVPVEEDEPPAEIEILDGAAVDGDGGPARRAR